MISVTYSKLNKMVDQLGDLTNGVIGHHEKDYFAAYENHMIKV